MAKIMDIIAKETNGKSYNTEKYSFDSLGMPSFDYDDDPSRVMKWKESAETEAHKKPIRLIESAKQISNNKPLLLVHGTLWWGKAQNTIRIRLCGRSVSYFNKSRIRKRLFQNCIEPAL